MYKLISDNGQSVILAKLQHCSLKLQITTKTQMKSYFTAIYLICNQKEHFSMQME